MRTEASRPLLRYALCAAPSVDYEAATRVINQNIQVVQMSGTQFLGVLHQDEQALYAGLLIAIETEGRKLPQAEILAITLLGKVPVSITCRGRQKRKACSNIFLPRKSVTPQF